MPGSCSVQEGQRRSHSSSQYEVFGVILNWRSRLDIQEGQGTNRRWSWCRSPEGCLEAEPRLG